MRCRKYSKSILSFLLCLFLCSCQEEFSEAIIDFVVPTIEQTKEVKTYDRIMIFGVDGAGGEFENVDTPNFDRIFSTGNIDYHGESQIPSASAENWSAMFFGVKSKTYKLSSDKLPTFIQTYSERHEDSTFYSVVNWNIINNSFFENIDSLTKETPKNDYPDLLDEQIDEIVAEKVIQRLDEYNDKIIFAHFGYVDYCGHTYGRVSQEYKNSIKYIDKLMGTIFDAFIKHNLLSSTLFICASDHGHTNLGGHGGTTIHERTVTIAVNGKKGNIIKGTIGSYSTYCFAPIILFALGETQPDHYEGGVPNHLFLELEEPSNTAE